MLKLLREVAEWKIACMPCFASNTLYVISQRILQQTLTIGINH